MRLVRRGFSEPDNDGSDADADSDRDKPVSPAAGDDSDCDTDSVVTGLGNAVSTDRPSGGASALVEALLFMPPTHNIT